jgi:predicted DNA-binding transcriptional regulator YafY
MLKKKDVTEFYYLRDRAAYKDLDEWVKNLKLVTKAKGEAVEFSYEDSHGEATRRKVKLSEILLADNGNVYLRGHCQLRQEKRTFNIYKITSPVKHGSSRSDVEEYLYSEYGIEIL